MLSRWLAGSKDDERVKELEEKVADLEKRLFKQQKKNMLMQFRLELFKGFSPRLWFEYFSPDANKFSHSAKAQKNYEKWLEGELKRKSENASSTL